MRSLVDVFRGARTPAQTVTPVPYAGRYTGGGFSNMLSPSGDEAQLKAVGGNGTLFAIVEAYATAASGVDWHLYRSLPPGAGANDELERMYGRPLVTSHAALDLWEKPNAFYDQPLFIKTLTQHLELVGIAYSVVLKIGSLPIELWPVRPDRIEPVPHPQKFIAGYIYHGPDGQKVPLRVDEVIRLVQNPCPWDPFRGMGAVQTVMADLYGAAAASEWHRMFFVNSARPDGIIQVPESLSDVEFDQFQERWAETHKGVNNAHKVAMLENGAEWKQVSFSPHDMQFVDLRRADAENIREAFRMSETVLGRGETLNRATAEAQMFQFASTHVVPRLETIWRRGFLNGGLLPMYGNTGRGLEFDYVSPVPEDKEARDRNLVAQATAYKSYVDAGVSGDDPDMLRHLGLPEMGWARQQPAQSLRPEPAAVEATNVRVLPAAHNGHRHPHPPALPGPRAADDDDDPEPDLSGVRDDLEDALEEFEQAFAPILARQIDSLVEQVEAAIDADDLDALTGFAVPDDLTGADLLRQALGGLAGTAARRAARECAAQGVDVVAPDVDEDLTDLGLPHIVNFGLELVEVARVTMEIAAGYLASGAATEALRHWTPGATGRKVAGKVRDKLEALKGSERVTQVGAAMHRATNLARGATFAAAMKLRRGGRAIASEQNDRSTCEPCSQWDGHVFDSLAEAREMYDAGGYPDCEGRERCRGTYFLRWKKAR